MTVLEAMSVGTPVVMTEDCGLADELEGSGAALVTDGSAGSLADAVSSILSDDATRDGLRAGMSEALTGSFGVESVVADLTRIYTGGTS
jgi:glycosyltransferase involved in cell wall biosynthesis